MRGPAISFKIFKKAMLRFAACAIFYARAQRLLNGLANRFQINPAKKVNRIQPLISRRRARDVQILTYHRVNDDYDDFFPAVPTAVFARQMEYLAAVYNVLPLDEAVKRMGYND